jgi:protein TonB
MTVATPREDASPPSDAKATAAHAASAAAAAAAAEASFEGRLLQAVQTEARRSYPASARLMGITGQAVVAFDYHDGAVRVTRLAQSSGSPILDRAAMAAVQDANYPPPPLELAGHILTKVVHVKFELNSS